MIMPRLQNVNVNARLWNCSGNAFCPNGPQVRTGDLPLRLPWPMSKKSSQSSAGRFTFSRRLKSVLPDGPPARRAATSWRVYRSCQDRRHWSSRRSGSAMAVEDCRVGLVDRGHHNSVNIDMRWTTRGPYDGFGYVLWLERRDVLVNLGSLLLVSTKTH